MKFGTAAFRVRELRQRLHLVEILYGAIKVAIYTAFLFAAEDHLTPQNFQSLLLSSPPGEKETSR